MSKLVDSLQPKTPMEFIELLLFLKVDYIWCIVLYETIVLRKPYEKAGAPFGITKNTVYERLKSIRRRLDKITH